MLKFILSVSSRCWMYNVTGCQCLEWVNIVFFLNPPTYSHDKLSKADEFGQATRAKSLHSPFLEVDLSGLLFISQLSAVKIQSVLKYHSCVRVCVCACLVFPLSRSCSILVGGGVPFFFAKTWILLIKHRFVVLHAHIIRHMVQVPTFRVFLSINNHQICWWNIPQKVLVTSTSQQTRR